ncbi:hypothetical protein ACEQ8H_000002 [Pleosporales sp. CAS-2024a]
MGDPPPGSQPQALDSTATGFVRDEKQGLCSPSTTPSHSQLSTIPPQHQLRPDYRSAALSAPQYPPSEYGASSLNMLSMMGALPEYGSTDEPSLNGQGSHSVLRSLPGASTSATTYQLGHNMQLPSHASANMMNQPSYQNAYTAGPYQQQQVFGQSSQHGAYPPYGHNQPRLHNAMVPPTFQSYPGTSQYIYYSAPYGHQGPYNTSYATQGLQNHVVYGRRASATDTPHNMSYQHLDGGYQSARPGAGGPQVEQGAMGLPFMRAPATTEAALPSSIPRGPPRKPKQSGHALWVGNLPPGTTIMALKDHFSREATNDIESLFLISKSNCAFVNYRSEASCTAAMHRFHDCRFNGVRLVCRLRRSSASTSGVPTGPSAMAGSQQTNASLPQSPSADGAAVENVQDGPTDDSPCRDVDVNSGTSSSPNRYFIVKSLTLQDLELSVRNGIWATQSHNEDVLNQAFRSTQNVFLIFSANKSGEYFGYARMTSAILEDSSQMISSAPKPENMNMLDATDVPKSILTCATEWAPRGKVIDDSARGTIFWEAELSETETDNDVADKEDRAMDADAENSVVAQSWGKPFKIEWCSTQRLPFYRTRGLRNPWNANREVKIARDGTELEPSVGDRLVAMFHRLGPSGAGAGAPMSAPHPQLGMPQVRPF